ncbi:MAG: hypothetical protein OSB73_24365, partial [Candidatus Latescibacteria bacterium]|nr:hypothetical protein [Candidatus Latescibacterota bacterium]
YVGTSINQTLRDVRLAQAFRILSRHPPQASKKPLITSALPARAISRSVSNNNTVFYPRK